MHPITHMRITDTLQVPRKGRGRQGEGGSPPVNPTLVSCLGILWTAVPEPMPEFCCVPLFTVPINRPIRLN